ncbi:unnamed protein product [Vitrella brassicaformis CCMP3155]|uniref:Endoglucanase n=3 Tax=Vitrella brassicaformis TaxID=1169539 RepID=A0A0G4H697_VITBC|nr:unnamed protein product [Vitrella brassicaformis CCMP3155]|eukprot:CEM39355.1 unnamed protein product [Vitrella brassicaformis CCMP3155]
MRISHMHILMSLVLLVSRSVATPLAPSFLHRPDAQDRPQSSGRILVGGEQDKEHFEEEEPLGDFLLEGGEDSRPAYDVGKGSVAFDFDADDDDRFVASERDVREYEEVLRRSFLFFSAQQLGRLGKDHPIKWRGDAALLDGLKDNTHEPEGRDLVGGYADAADHTKWNFNQAYAMTMLSWMAVDFRPLLQRLKLWNTMLETARWGLEYLAKCHIEPNVMYAGVGIADEEWFWWGRPEDIHTDGYYRPSWVINETHPGSDLAGESAAAFAACSMAFRASDDELADICLRHAVELFEFADKYRGLYSDHTPGEFMGYISSGYLDEIVWGALWLYRATGNQTYLDKAIAMEKDLPSFADGDMSILTPPTPEWGPFWNDKHIWSLVLLTQLTDDPLYEKKLSVYTANLLPGGYYGYLPSGLAMIWSWGNNRHISSAVAVASHMAMHTGDRRLYRWAKRQVDLLIGNAQDMPEGERRSYVVGYGPNPPLRVAHKTSYCPSFRTGLPCNEFVPGSTHPGPNLQTLTGALVGGPTYDGYLDKRDQWNMNEPAIDYNAHLIAALVSVLNATDLPADKGTEK